MIDSAEASEPSTLRIETTQKDKLSPPTPSGTSYSPASASSTTQFLYGSSGFEKSQSGSQPVFSESLETETPGKKKQRQKGKLGLLTLCAITYFLVAGGPYGLENMVGAVPNPFIVLTSFVLFPVIYALPLSLVCAELATAIPDNGGVMTWTKEAFGHYIGYLVGFCVSITYLLDISLYPAMFLAYLDEALGYELGFWAKWGIGCGVVFLLTLINIIGLEVVGWVSIFFVIAVSSPFFVIPILGIGYLNPSVFINGMFKFPQEADWGYFLTLLVWNNSGWISPGFLAGETKNPNKIYPRAMIITMVFANMTYAIPVAIGMCINRDWANWDIGFFAKIGYQLAGKWLMIWIIVASMVTNAGLFNAAVSTSSRSIASFADQKYFPRLIGYKIPKLNTPIVAIMIDCVVTCILLALPFSSLIGAQTCVNSVNMVLLYAAFVVLRFKRKDMKRPFRVPLPNFLVIFIVLIPCGLSIWNLITSEWTSKVAAGVVLLLAMITYPIACWKDFKGFFVSLKARWTAWRTGKRYESPKTSEDSPELSPLHSPDA